MFNTMIGKYFPANSKIHRMNSTSKIICILVFLIALSLCKDLLMLGLLVALTIIMMVASRVPIKFYLKSINGIKVLLIFILIINLISGVKPIDTLIIVVKLMLGVLYTIVLTYTTSSTEITYGLEEIFKPLKILKLPVNKIALSISLALRFIPTIFEQAEKILKSQASRGIDYSYSNFKGKVTAISSMLLPMFILSFKRADNLADAMEVRLYNYANSRTNYRMNKWGNFDNIMIFAHLLILTLIIIKGVII